MTPYEINQKICYIKGGYERTTMGFTGEDRNFYKHTENWAENIADVWELVEEMTREGLIKPDSHFNIVKDPMTICITYLHWKKAI